MGTPSGNRQGRGGCNTDYRQLRSFCFRCVSTQFRLLCLISRRPYNCFLLFADQALYLGVTFVSRACAFARAYGSMVSSFGFTHRTSRAVDALLSSLCRTLLARVLRYYLLAAGP